MKERKIGKERGTMGSASRVVQTCCFMCLSIENNKNENCSLFYDCCLQTTMGFSLEDSTYFRK